MFFFSSSRNDDVRLPLVVLQLQLSLSLQTLITVRRVFPVRRSAVRFATLKRRFRFNAYFSLCSFCLSWDIFVYLQNKQTTTTTTHTLVSPKCLRNFFFVNSCLFFLFPSVCFLPLLSHYFWPIFCFFRLIFLRFLSVVALEVRRKNK